MSALVAFSSFSILLLVLSCSSSSASPSTDTDTVHSNLIPKGPDGLPDSSLSSGKGGDLFGSGAAILVSRETAEELRRVGATLATIMEQVRLERTKFSPFHFVDQKENDVCLHSSVSQSLVSTPVVGRTDECVVSCCDPRPPRRLHRRGEELRGLDRRRYRSIHGTAEGTSDRNKHLFYIKYSMVPTTVC